MIDESPIDAVLNRLSAHFGPRMVIRPPTSPDELSELEAVIGPLPRAFVVLLTRCNGLRINMDGSEPGQHLWNTREMVCSILAAPSPGVPEGFVPFCGDPTGERDWLIVGGGPADNAVLRWDPWVPGAELVASGFGSYLEGWSRYVTCWFDSNGLPTRSPGDRPVFDVRSMEAQDDEVVRLSRDVHVRQWLQEIDRAVACGDDFE